LLQSAERAFAELKFDAARTFVESARKVDPNIPQAVTLLQRIRERELRYLRDETQIR
jgi:hypothetical protein